MGGVKIRNRAEGNGLVVGRQIDVSIGTSLVDYAINHLHLAIHFIGDFRHMKVRTVARQEKDGVGLADAAKNEAVFEYTDVRGDLVGFRLPGYVNGVNAPGWHLHFVDAERQHGGHVVNFSLRDGELQYCYANDIQIWLPDAATLAGLNLARDWSEELKRAEAER